jgi:hypothetical protein
VNHHPRVLAVAEDQHQVAGRVEEIERLEQPTLCSIASLIVVP